MFGEKILAYWDDILEDLRKAVAIPSVAKPAEGPHPFGDECAKAIDAVLGMAQGYGLKTQNVGYYAAHAEIGQGEGNAVVMAHLDVVPAGEGWDGDPFTMAIQDGMAYGRGVADNKGAAIVALHCLRALRDAGVQGKRKLRVIFGSGEEIGMDDMPHYFAQEQLPDMGFTPDAEYGICHCEKGGINFTVTGKNDSPVVKSFSAGTVVNAVPAKASCQVACTQEEYDRLCQAAGSAKTGFEVARTEDGASILAVGQAAHASTPWNGVNAASCLIELLYGVFGERAGTFFRFAHEKIGMSHDGGPMGVKLSDEPSGPLTFNLGLVHVDKNACSLTVDIRYPATLDGGEISATLEKETAPYAGLTYTLLSNSVPLYLPKESQLVTLLSGAYKDVTGEECEIFSMGGGTYARTMQGRGVAFGPGFKGGPDSHAHDVNERIDLERFKLHAQICLEAMYRMYTAD